MARQKSRTTLLAEALDQARKAQASLLEIDLRSTRGELRDAIRYAREDAANAVTNLGVALEHDVPAQPTRQRVSV